MLFFPLRTAAQTLPALLLSGKEIHKTPLSEFLLLKIEAWFVCLFFEEETLQNKTFHKANLNLPKQGQKLSAPEGIQPPNRLLYIHAPIEIRDLKFREFRHL